MPDADAVADGLDEDDDEIESDRELLPLGVPVDVGVPVPVPERRCEPEDDPVESCDEDARCEIDRLGLAVPESEGVCVILWVDVRLASCVDVGLPERVELRDGVRVLDADKLGVPVLVGVRPELRDDVIEALCDWDALPVEDADNVSDAVRLAVAETL